MPELISPLELEPADPALEDAGSPGEPAPAPDPGDDLAAVRDLVLRAHPDVVPELVTGDTVGDLIASVEPARAAYQRLAAAIAETRPASAPVPAGGAAPIAVDPARLPAAEKIRRGLATARTAPASTTKKG